MPLSHQRCARCSVAAFLLCAVLTSPSANASQSPQGVTILSSSERSLVLEFRPEYLQPQTVVGNGEQFVVMDFEGSVNDVTEDGIGMPDLRYRSITLGFPAETGNVVQIVSADYEDMPNVSLAPVPSLRVREGIVEPAAYSPDRQAYAVNSFLPSSAARISGIGQSRSMVLGAVNIYPLQYNPFTRTVRKHSRVVVEVIFAAPRANRVRNGDDILFRNVLLNYDVAKDWKFGPSRPLAKLVTSSVLALGFWYRIPVIEEGVYLLDATYLRNAGVDVDDVDPRTIKIYGNGGKEVPESVVDPRPEDLVENALYVEGEADGVFNDSDFIVFYGRSVRGWTYNPVSRLFDHNSHHYSDVNFYWLTYGGVSGKRMQGQQSLSDNPAVVPSSFTGLVGVNEDTVNLMNSGREWYGPAFNAGSSIVYTNQLPGLIPGQPVTYRYSIVVRSIDAVPSLLVKQGNVTLQNTVEPTLLTAGWDEFRYAREKTFTVTSSAGIVGTTSQLTFTLTSASLSASAWINRLEIQYPRNFSALSNYLRFRSPDTLGVVEYRLTGFTAAPFILNVTDPLNVGLVSGATGTYTFRAAEVPGVVSEYCAVAAGGYKVPGPMQFITNQDLRGIAEGYDFIIVTVEEFRSAADRLAAFREQPAHGNLRTLVVEVDEIYNEFSGGVSDVTGIRDFLKYAYDNWARPPMFVLFLGQGSYDFKARLGFRSSYVPAWETLQSLNDLDSYASEDFYAKFGTSTALSLVTGRINARSSAEADVAVDKTIAYENGSARDPWKMRILIVGDDSWTSEGEDGTLHSAQAEILAEDRVPPVFEKRKIYIAEYPTVITAQGRRKPGAYQAIIDEINRGALIVNFTGHGNPTVWTHESIFVVTTSIPQLVNADRLSVLFLATCNFSQFDDPNRYTGAELLLNKPDGGAIGVVSATDKVFANLNFDLNKEIYQNMFVTDQFGRAVVERPATATFLTKTVSSVVNDQKFFYMGDPTTRLQFPTGYASIDTVNGESVDSVNGSPRAIPVQIKALQKVTVEGAVRDVNNQIDDQAGGTVTLTVDDATRFFTIIPFIPGYTDANGVYHPPINWSYVLQGGTIYRGENSVTSGRFSATFIVPKDISYADSTTRGRLVAYALDGDTDGAGYTGNVYVGGTDTTAEIDNIGPSMSLYLNSRGFRPGDVVTDDPLLIVDLTDSSGINTSGYGIGHRMEAWLNNSALSVDITDFYTSAIDNFQQGTVEYPMRDLPFGRNSLRVRAWDAFNNSATAETFFEVASGDELSLRDVMNYPNPFSSSTSFTFRQNQLMPLHISIKVYSVAGRLIQSIETTSPGDPFIQIPWDGRDRDGDLLANGVYLYKVIVNTVDGRYASEVLGKLSVLR